MENNELIRMVLKASTGCAPDMTHALCSLGGGNMGKGIIVLYRSGIVKGASITLIVSSVIGGVVLLCKHHKNKLDEAERETADVCPKFATPVCEKRCKKCTVSQEEDNNTHYISENKTAN